MKRLHLEKLNDRVSYKWNIYAINLFRCVYTYVSCKLKKMNHLLTAILLLIGLKVFSCDCYNSPTAEIIDSFQDIFVAQVESGNATIIKTWKGDFAIDSTFKYDFEKYDCAMYSFVDNGFYVFYVNSTENKYCNLTEPYYYNNHTDFLEESYKSSKVESSKYQSMIDGLEYERKYIVHAEEKFDINGKKAIFVVRHRFLNWFTRFTIEKFENIERYVGFYSTRFHLIAKDYSSKHCDYDFVFWVTYSHQGFRVTDSVERRVKRKIKKACS